jgi:hypothetical protein
MGRDTTIWGHDARDYNPDRWTCGEKFPAHKFAAFHAGPRTWYNFYLSHCLILCCESPTGLWTMAFISYLITAFVPIFSLGQQFATAEAITILAILLQRFTFELVNPDTEPGYLPGLTLRMAEGLPLRVHHRPGFPFS